MKEIRINKIINIKGTIIDFETTHWDHKEGELITAGFLYNSGISIFQRLMSTEGDFKKMIQSEINQMNRPWYAFNKEFEEKFLNIQVDNEIQQRERESAFGALLNEDLLEHYNSLCDPCFNDEIKNFWDAYRLQKDLIFLSKISRHNYCCLVKEYYLTLKREGGLAASEIVRFPSSAQIEKNFIRKQLGI